MFMILEMGTVRKPDFAACTPFRTVPASAYCRCTRHRLSDTSSVAAPGSIVDAPSWEARTE